MNLLCESEQDFWPLWEHPETKTLAAKPETLMSKVRSVASQLHSPRSCLRQMKALGLRNFESLCS